MDQDTKQLTVIAIMIVFIILIFTVFSTIGDYRDREIIKFCIENGVDLTLAVCNID